MRVAYQGEPGAYSEAAALTYAPGADVVPCPSFDEVFRTVEAGTVALGVLPIENSIGGTIHRNYDLLLEHDLTIVGDLEIRVVHSLLALPGVALGQVRQIFSHPQALAQCDRFLRGLPGVEVVATYDTAGSAKLLQDRQLTDAAAIASERAARVFGLAVLQTGIQDHSDNFTRFLVVSRTDADRPSDEDTNKTTIVFSLPNEPGALFKALSVFALRGIDLTKLESRPLPGRPWEYLFYVDLRVGADVTCARALAHLAEFAPTLRNLGSYRSSLARRNGHAADPAAAGPAHA